jgi:hypothetical protein
MQPERRVNLRLTVNGHEFGTINQGTDATFNVPSGPLTVAVLLGTVGNTGPLMRHYVRTGEPAATALINLFPGQVADIELGWRHPSPGEADFVPYIKQVAAVTVAVMADALVAK